MKKLLFMDTKDETLRIHGYMHALNSLLWDCFLLLTLKLHAEHACHQIEKKCMYIKN